MTYVPKMTEACVQTTRAIFLSLQKTGSFSSSQLADELDIPLSRFKYYLWCARLFHYPIPKQSYAPRKARNPIGMISLDLGLVGPTHVEPQQRHNAVVTKPVHDLPVLSLPAPIAIRLYKIARRTGATLHMGDDGPYFQIQIKWDGRFRL
jgi:hypothetical protein